MYKGITDVISQMWGKEGALSLYRGLWPTLIQIGPYVGCQFALYRFLIEKYDEFVEKDSHNSLRSLSCGAIAGALSKTLVYPLDLTKKRLQMQGFAEKHNYKGYNLFCYCIYTFLIILFSFFHVPDYWIAS